jgi:heat shock protein HslJ
MAGCNEIDASYSLHGQQLQLGRMIITDVFCADAVVRGQENSYFEALHRVQIYQITETTLLLRGDSDRVQLTFRAS